MTLEDENRRLREALTPSEERLDWIADKLCETWGSLDEGPETKDTQRFVRAVLDVLRADAALAAEPASGEANPKATGVPWVDGWLPAIETMSTRAPPPPSGEADMYAEAFREAAITGQAFVKDGRLLKSEDVYAPPPPPTQGEEERADKLIDYFQTVTSWGLARATLIAALRQRADEATRAAALACERLNADKIANGAYEHGYWDACNECAAAIRARITP